MKQLSLQKKRLCLLALPLGAPLLYGLWRLFEVTYVPLHIPCLLHALTGLYCPGCGCTRSMRALMSGHPWLAVRCNPLIPAGVVLGIAWYIEQIAACFFGKEIKIIPRSNVVRGIALGMYLLFAILRNRYAVLAPPL